MASEGWAPRKARDLLGERARDAELLHPRPGEVQGRRRGGARPRGLVMRWLGGLARARRLPRRAICTLLRICYAVCRARCSRLRHRSLRAIAT